MAKKKHKKSARKHSFTHSNVPAAASRPATSSAVAPKTAVPESNEWQIVRGDVRRVLVLAVLFIVVEVVLKFILSK